MPIGLDIGGCTRDPETCPAVEGALQADDFYEVVDGVCGSTQHIRDTLGEFVSTCVIGSCPGRNIETTKHVLRAFLDANMDDERKEGD